jgi:NAD dependent epimerase/dehydratase family enzyme
MADAAILNGQRVLPSRALELGFTFKYPTIEAALAAVYRQPASGQ